VQSKLSFKSYAQQWRAFVMNFECRGAVPECDDTWLHGRTKQFHRLTCWRKPQDGRPFAVGTLAPYTATSHWMKASAHSPRTPAAWNESTVSWMLWLAVYRVGKQEYPVWLQSLLKRYKGTIKVRCNGRGKWSCPVAAAALSTYSLTRVALPRVQNQATLLSCCRSLTR
jgi:hypothetical protein